MITILETCDYRDKAPSTGEYYWVDGSKSFMTKQITSTSIIPAAMVKKFRLVESRNIDTLAELYPVLSELEKQPRKCVIRYKYHSAQIGDIVYRRATELVNTKHRIIAIDIDELELPDHIESTDLVAQGKYIRNLLNEVYPDFFNNDTGFIVQGSSSAGMGRKFKLHMWFRNKSPITQQQIKNAMYYINRAYKRCFSVSENLIDLALYSTGQIHFTAAPIIQKDPFPKGRTFYVEGGDCYIPATFPEWVKPVQATNVERNEYLDSIQGSSTPTNYVAELLDKVRCWNPTERGLRTKVIALYHNAIQTQYNLDLLDREVKKILSVARPGQENAYVAEAKNAAMNFIKACSGRDIHDEVLGIPVATLDGGSHARFLELKAFPKDTAVFLKASLGTGKTATIERMLSDGSIKGTFLAITDTSALVEANCQRFNALDYRDVDNIKDFNAGKTNKLSGTLHSVHKLVVARRKFNFVFIDEADSVLNNLLFASIISDDKRVKLIEVLSDILQKADRVVFSDGDLSQETVQCYTELMAGSKNIAKVIHTRKSLKDVTAHRHKSPQSIWGAVDAALHAGDKCLVVTDNSPDKLNIYQDVLRRVHPDLKIEVAHANSKFDDITRDIINNTTEALRRNNISCLICSPSITSGVDFNYFDTVFVLTSTEIHSPNMRFQALMRERSPREIHYYIKPTIKGFDTGYSQLSVDEGWTNASRKLYSARKEREFKTYSATFNYYLIKAGCTIKYVDDPYVCPKEQEDVEAYYDEKAMAVLKSAEGAIVPRHNNLLKTYQLIQTLWELPNPTFDDVRRFVVDDPSDKLMMFHRIANEFWDVLCLNNPSALKTALEGSRGHKFYLLTGMSIRSKSAREILKSCGIEEDTDMNSFVELYKRFCICMSFPIAESINKLNTHELGAF